MSEQGYEYDQYAQPAEGRLFSSSMFGFNKEEVLEYLDELADENYQRQEAADLQIQELTQKLQAVEESLQNIPETSEGANPAELEELRGHTQQLSEDLDIARAATQQAEEDLAEIRENLFNMQQENNWLREEREKTDTEMAELRRKVDSLDSGEWDQKAEIEQKLADAQKQIEELNTKLETAGTAINGEDGKKIAEAERKLAEVTEKLSAAASLNEELTARVQAAEGRYAEAERQSAITLQQVADANRRAEQTQNELKRVAQQAATAQTAESKSRIISEQLSAMQAKAKEAQAKIVKSDIEIEELKKQLEEALANQNDARATAASAAIIAEANDEAERIRAVALEEKERIRRQIQNSAGGLAESVTNLRGDLSGVENDVTIVLEAIQTALADIMAALNRTEQNLNTLGVQVERFPATSAAVPKQQVVYFQPSEDVIAPPAMGTRTRKATPVETLRQSSFRRVGVSTTDEKLRPFRPTYTNSPAAAAVAYQPEEEDDNRKRASLESIIETLSQMLD